MRRKYSYRGLSFPSHNVTSYLSSCQTGFSRSQVPRQVVDTTQLAPLLCIADDDYQSIAPNMEAPHLNPEPPTYALRFCSAPGWKHLLGLANEDGAVAVQDTSKVQPKLPLPGLKCHDNAIFSLCWSETEATRLVTVSGDQTVGVWDLGNQQDSISKVRLLRGHSRSVKCVEWRPDTATEFATGGRDNNVLVWDLRSASDQVPDNAIRGAHTPLPGPRRRGPSSPSTQVPACSVTAMCWVDSNTLVTTGDSDGTVKVWDMRRNYSLYRREPVPKMEINHPGTSSTQGYTAISLDPSHNYIYTSCMDGNIYKYDVINGFQKPSAVFTGAEIKNFFITHSLSPCGQFLASGSSDHSAYLWNTASPGGPVARLGPQEAEVTCVAWRRDQDRGMMLAAASDDMRHRLWRPRRERDDLLIRGRVEMLDKVELQPHFSPRKPLLQTPSSRTPRARRTELSSSKKTPSIKSFLTPNRQLTPISKALASHVTPTNEVKRGLKRRTVDFGDENCPEAKSPRIQSSCRDLTGSIAGLLSSTSPIKCTFTPASYKSPIKRPPLSSPLRLSSPLKNLLREDLPRTPLETLTASPTANLPNLVVDGGKVQGGAVGQVVRKPNWLVTLGKQRKVVELGTRSSSPSCSKTKGKIKVKSRDKLDK